LPTKESNIEEYALVSVYQDEILLRLDRETFYQMVDELVKTNINRLKSDEINIPGDIEKKLLPMLVELENILHDYKSEELWALQYRRQKRKIAKLIHPDTQKNKKAAALIAPIIIHSLFEGIDKLIEKLDSNKLLNTYDAEVESFFKDIWQSMKESTEKMKWLEKQIKEMTLFHQEASEQIEKMGEEIKQISADYRRMFEETKKSKQSDGRNLKETGYYYRKGKSIIERSGNST
jgi:tRNA nucleotidyltransferase/poly(A) polymerase